MCFITRFIQQITHHHQSYIFLQNKNLLQMSLSPFRGWYFPPRFALVWLSVPRRFPFWPRLREAEPHDPEAQPSDPAQPRSPAEPRKHPAQPNGSSAGPDGHSAGSSTCPVRPDTNSDWSSSAGPSCTRSLPARTSWIPAEPGQPALRPPPTALPPRRQVRGCSCRHPAGTCCEIC